eukprot:TRINITY_DN1471_c0_g1_i2.p1 TRINITY_DN1471_c0_g1~~TRINITY_DN1471_c0_g1_i2.p1  ORF type:complete len:329 (+),score=21.12 TRINITY_DN1471_c0_g1_i2:49-1035(+)
MSSSSLRTAAVFAHGKWQNPFASWSSSIIDSGMKGYADIMKWQLTRRPPAPTTAELDQMLPVVPIDWAKLRNPPADKVQCTWIGHASFLIQMCGINLLTDPVFCNRVSPISFVGPARQRPTPCAISELPKIDAVVISHNHYDHLDASVVHALGNTARWFAPLGMKSWFEGQGVANVTEMTWWQETQFTPRVKMCCVPCSHWCKRTLFDTNKALWSSWAVVGDTARFYFAGDTGYCEAFQQIGDEYGPFDLAAIPVCHVSQPECCSVLRTMSNMRFPHISRGKLEPRPFLVWPSRLNEHDNVAADWSIRTTVITVVIIGVLFLGASCSF